MYLPKVAKIHLKFWYSAIIAQFSGENNYILKQTVTKTVCFVSIIYTGGILR